MAENQQWEYAIQHFLQRVDKRTALNGKVFIHPIRWGADYFRDRKCYRVWFSFTTSGKDAFCILNVTGPSDFFSDDLVDQLLATAALHPDVFKGKFTENFIPELWSKKLAEVLAEHIDKQIVHSLLKK
jgi:hypothetical protein